MELFAKRENIASKPFMLFGNLLGEEEGQPREKTVTTQTKCETYSDIHPVMHTDPADKNEDSFFECIKMLLLTHFLSDAKEKEKALHQVRTQER